MAASVAVVSNANGPNSWYLNGWMDRWMDGRTDGQMDGRMDGWIKCEATVKLIKPENVML